MIPQIVNDIMKIYLENEYYLIGIFPTKFDDIKVYEVKIKVFTYTIHIYYIDNGKKNVMVLGRDNNGI